MSPHLKDEGVCLDHLPLTFEGEVALSPALGHLGKEEGVGRAHLGSARPKVECLKRSSSATF